MDDDRYCVGFYTGMMVKIKPAAWNAWESAGAVESWNLHKHVANEEAVFGELRENMGLVQRLDACSTGLTIKAMTFTALCRLELQMHAGQLLLESCVVCHGLASNCVPYIWRHCPTLKSTVDLKIDAMLHGHMVLNVVAHLQSGRPFHWTLFVVQHRPVRCHALDRRGFKSLELPVVGMQRSLADQILIVPDGLCMAKSATLSTIRKL